MRAAAIAKSGSKAAAGTRARGRASELLPEPELAPELEPELAPEPVVEGPVAEGAAEEVWVPFRRSALRWGTCYITILLLEWLD